MAEETKTTDLAPEEQLCECCGERPAEPGGQYCSACLEHMKKYPFRWWQFIVPAVMVMFVVLAVLITMTQWTVYSGTAEAERYVRNSQLNTALTKYAALNAKIEDSTADQFGVRYLANQVDLYETIGIQEISEESTFLDTYYPGTALQKPWNKKAAKAAQKVSDFQTVYQAFNTALSEGQDFESVLKAFDESVEGKGLNEAYANYCRYYACLMFEQSTKTQKKYVDAIKAEGKEYASMYLPLYAEISLNSQNFKETLTYTSQMKELNAEDAYCYAYAAVAYRMQGDLAKATKQLNDGLDYNSTSGMLNYQMSILYLLNGQYKLAEAYADTAFENAETEYNYQSAASIYALIAELRARKYQKADKDEQYTDEHSIYTTILANLESYGYEVSPDVEKILDGEKTVKEVFMEGTGDFSW